MVCICGRGAVWNVVVLMCVKRALWVRCVVTVVVVVGVARVVFDARVAQFQVVCIAALALRLTSNCSLVP